MLFLSTNEAEVAINLRELTNYTKSGVTRKALLTINLRSMEGWIQTQCQPFRWLWRS